MVSEALKPSYADLKMRATVYLLLVFCSVLFFLVFVVYMFV